MRYQPGTGPLFYLVNISHLPREVKSPHKNPQIKKLVSRSISPYIYKPLPPFKKSKNTNEMNVPFKKTSKSTQTEGEGKEESHLRKKDQEELVHLRDCATSPLYKPTSLELTNGHFDDLEKLTGHIVIHKFFTRGEVDLNKFINTLACEKEQRIKEVGERAQEKALDIISNIEEQPGSETASRLDENEVKDEKDEVIQEICEQIKEIETLSSEPPELEEVKSCSENDIIHCECFPLAEEEPFIKVEIIKPSQEFPITEETLQEACSSDQIQFPILIPSLSPLFGTSRTTLTRSLSLDSGFQGTCTESNSQNSQNSFRGGEKSRDSGRKSQSLLEIQDVPELRRLQVFNVQLGQGGDLQGALKHMGNKLRINLDEDDEVLIGECDDLGIIDEYLPSSEMSDRSGSSSIIVGDLDTPRSTHSKSIDRGNGTLRKKRGVFTSSNIKSIHSRLNKSTSVQTANFRSSASSLSTVDSSNNDSPLNIDLQIVSKRIPESPLGSTTSARGYLPTSSSSLNVLNLDLNLEQGEKINVNLKVTRDKESKNKGGQRGVAKVNSKLGKREDRMLKNTSNDTVDDKIKRSLDRLSKTRGGGGGAKK